MIMAMLIFGSIGIFVKNIDISSGMLALVRGAVGAFFLTAVSPGGRKRDTPLRKEGKGMKQNGWLLILSGAAIGANWICLFESYRYTTVAIATLCYYLAPVFVIAASPLFLKERLTPVKAVCAAVSLLGMLPIAGIGNGNVGGGDARGILFGVAAAILYACVIIMNKRLKEIKPVPMTIFQLGAASLVLLPYVLMKEGLGENSETFHPSVNTVLLLLTVGIVHTGIAYLLYFSSLVKLSAQQAALFSYIDPVTAILLSALLLHEEMSILQAAGAVLILGAALFSEISGKWRKESDMGGNRA